MFYANTDTKRFIAAPSSNSDERPLPAGCRCSIVPLPQDIKKPVLTNFQQAYIQITFLDNDALPMDLTGYTLALALDNTFSHSDSLIAPIAESQILSPLDGIAGFRIKCTSRKFQKLVNAKVPPQQIWMEVTAYPPGSTQGFVILQDSGIRLLPKLYTHQGAPQDGSPNYYTKQQVDAIVELLDARIKALQDRL